MGGGCSMDAAAALEADGGPASVFLHIYDLGEDGSGSLLNRILQPCGTGAFHCGVEVHGQEWSYSDVSDATSPTMTGIFVSVPRRCIGHTYRRSVAMGCTSMTQHEVGMLLRALERDWIIGTYDMLRRNCCHFSNEMCLRMGVGPIPRWITNLAGAGALVLDGDFADATCCRMVAAQMVGDMCCEPEKHVTEARPAGLPAPRRGFPCVRARRVIGRAPFEEETVRRTVRSPPQSPRRRVVAEEVASAYSAL